MDSLPASWFPWIRVVSAFLLLITPFIAMILAADIPWGPLIALAATVILEWKAALPLLANLTRARYVMEVGRYPIGIGEAGPYALTYIRARALRDEAYNQLLHSLPLGWRTIITNLGGEKEVYILYRAFFLPLSRSLETARLLEILGFEITYPEDHIVRLGAPSQVFTSHDKGVVVIEPHHKERTGRVKLEFWRASLYPPGKKPVHLLRLRPRHLSERILVEYKLRAMLGVAKHGNTRQGPQRHEPPGMETATPRRPATWHGQAQDARRIHVYTEEDIKSLVEAAENNREKAFYALYMGDWNWACFHAHQAAELLLKAELARLKGSYPETHRLEELLRELGSLTPKALSLTASAKELSVHYTSARYPERARRRKIAYNEHTADKCIERMEEIFEAFPHIQR